MDLFNWDSVLDRFFGDSALDSDRLTGTRVPAVDISEDDTAYRMEIELPGLTEKDVEVKVENNTLTVSSKKEEKSEEKKKGYIRQERRHFSFSRSFGLPDHVDADKIDATFKNGLLNISVPKAPEAKPKMIEVKNK
jgi:HSP20 family protein